MSYYCPYPLAYAEPGQGNSIVWALESEGCAVRCPTITYTENEWDLLEDLVYFLMAGSVITTLISFVHHIYYYASKPAYFCRVMFLFGFMANCAIMIIFLGMNYRDHEVVCDGDGAYITNGGLCVFQAFWVIFFLIWIQTWSFFMALENYFQITNSIKGRPEAKYNKIYTIAAIFICSISAGVPLIQDNLGFDYKGNIPFCLFMISETRLYFVMFLFCPFCIFSGLCIIVTVLSIYEVQKIFVARDFTTNDSGLMMTPTRRSRSGAGPSLSISSAPGHRASDKSELTAALRAASADSHISESSESLRYSYSHEIDGEQSEDTVNPQHAKTFLNSQDDRSSCGERPSHKEPGVDFPIYDMNALPKNQDGYFGLIKKALIRTWQFNGRQMLFFLVFCVSTIAIIPIIHYIYLYGFDSFVNSNEEFVECLVYSGYKTLMTVPNATQHDFDYNARQDCGRYPVKRPHPILVSRNIQLLLMTKCFLINHFMCI